jgi:quinoprotein glucose dehydrogenase
VRELLASELAGRSVDELVALLSHRDQRVRQMAQFRLADLGTAAIQPLAEVAEKDTKRLARVHAIWGLGQIGGRDAAAYAPVLPLLGDSDGEIRAQAARVLGDGRVAAAGEGLIRLLGDEAPRARLYAALGLGKLGRADAVPALLKLLAENADQDPVLRHAGVMGLVGCGTDQALLAALSPDATTAERMGVLLALRRLGSPRVAMFLSATEQSLVAEAARAIYDVPINAALPELAALLTRDDLDEPTFARALAANHRLRSAEQAAAIAALALRPDTPVARRVLALEALADWPAPSGRDRVLGMWRPMEPVPAEVAAGPLHGQEAALFAGPPAVLRAAVRAATALGLSAAGPRLAELVADGQHTSALRAAALEALAQLRHPLAADAVRKSLSDGSPRVRLVARRLLAETNPELAVNELAKSLAEGTTSERQAALGSLAKIDLPAADTVLENWLGKLLAGGVPADIELDLLAAVAGRKSAAIQERLAQFEAARPADSMLAKYRESLHGGDAERGEEIFFTRADVSCQRCHKIGERGGEVGPDLSRIGAQQTREYLLAALVDPNRDVAKGFETVVLALADGRVVAGVLKAETDAELELVTPEALTVRVPKDQIDERTTGKSAMPEQTVGLLSKSDVRDLVEFLAGLQ